MTFQIKYNTFNTIEGTTEAWGVETVGQAVSHPRAKASLGLPDEYNLYVNNAQIDKSYPIQNGMTIVVEKVSQTKGS